MVKPLLRGVKGVRTEISLEGEERRNALLVARSVRNPRVDVGERLVRVAAAERAKTPVGLDGRKRGVVGVVSVVGRTDELLGDALAERNGVDVVVLLVRLVLVVRDQNERAVVVEALVGEQGVEEVFEPLRLEVDRCVVAVVDL